MSTRLGLWLLLSSLGFAYALWVYRRRELPVSSRNLLMGLRGAALSVVLLLLLDVQLPWSGSGGDAWWIVDTSASMGVRQGDSEAVPRERIPDGPPEARRLAFGLPAEGGVSPGDALPPARDSRLAPILSRALEAGAASVTVVSDLRVGDPVETAAVVRAARVPVRFLDVGGPTLHAGIAGIRLPDDARAGEPVQGEVDLFGEGIPEGRVVVEVDGVALWDTVVALHRSGRDRFPVRFTAPAEGPVPVRIRLLAEGDRYAGDDDRTAVLEVDATGGDLVLVSWSPDWEPRFLLPVLEEVTGLRGQGYLKVGPDRYMTMNGPVRFADAVEVAAALEESRLGVAHGFPEASPPPLADALVRAPRLLVLPGGGSPGGSAGEWYLSPEVPASPVAGEIAGIPLLGLPPLTGYRDPGSPAGRPALLVQRAARGDELPALVLREGPADARRVEALASGFWRWAFRDGPERELYRRLWSGVAGWLLAGGSSVREVGIGPSAAVVPPGEPLSWRAGPAAGGVLALRFMVSGDTTATGNPAPLEVPVDSLGRARVQAPDAAGVYAWEAEVERGPREGRTASGLLVVEEERLDLLHARAVSLLELQGGDVESGTARGERPLRTHPLPYLLLLGFLFAEWVGRRRSGLR